MPKAHLDFETGSAIDLTVVGVHRYAEEQSTRVWLFSWYMTGDNTIKRWFPGAPDPTILLNHIRSGGIVVAHGAMFERNIWRMTRAKYHLDHWPEIKIAQQECTIARSRTMNLPGSLERLGKVLGLKEQKDTEGAALMKRMMRPDKNGNWPLDTRDNLIRLASYCDQDIRAESEADRIVPSLSTHEQLVWQLDQTINDRGIPLDVPAIMRAADVVAQAKWHANAKMEQLTEGAVKKITEIAKIAKWINSRGVKCEAFRKGDHEELKVYAGMINDKVVQEVIELRQDSNKTSTAKYEKMLACVCADDSMRGQYEYHGANQTGRWAGRLTQPHNWVRVDWEKERAQIEFVLSVLHAPLSVKDCYETLCIGLDKPLVWLSKALRAMIKAHEDKQFIGADYSNIEGRFNAWLANETWKLEAFVAYDLGLGADIYAMSYERAFGIPPPSKEERQLGKIQELALGFQGGVGAYLKFVQTYQMKLEKIIKPVKSITPAETWDKVAYEYRGATDKFELLEEQWTAIKIIVKSWRAAHPAIVSAWKELENQALLAVGWPGHFFSVYHGRARYFSDGNYLYCQLPSGRVICYPQPHVRYVQKQMLKINDVWEDAAQFFEFELQAMREAGFEYKVTGKNTIFFHGVDEDTGQWVERHLYGGHQCENIVQAGSRCILDRAMLKVEAAGYPVILHSHDEIMAHVRKGVGSVRHFEQLMQIDEPWLAGFPLAVKGWQDERYMK